MKVRNSLISLVLLLGAVYARATSVTATINDGTNTWANCKWGVRLSNPRPDIVPSVNGVPLTANQLNQTGTCNGSGVLSVTLVDNNTIAPFGTTWLFNITPNASSAGGSGSVAVSGSSQSLSVFLSSIAPLVHFSAGPSSYGYADSNITGVPLPGQTYYNVTTPAFRQWTGSAWVTVGSGGSGSCSVVGSAGIFLATDGAAGCEPTPLVVDGSGNLTLTGTGGLTIPGFVSAGGRITLESSVGYGIISMDLIQVAFADVSIQSGPRAASPDSNWYIDTVGASDLLFRLGNGSSAYTTYAVGKIDPAVTVGQSVCVKAAGPPLVLGKCTSVVGAGGACTCS